MLLRRLRLCCCLALSAGACLGSVAESPPTGPGGQAAGPGGAAPGAVAGSGGQGVGMGPPGSGAGAGAGGVPGMGTDGCGFAPVRVWKLTPAQFGRAVASLLPGVADAGDRIAASVVASAGFSNDAGQLTLTGPHLNAVLEAAWQLADAAAATPDRLMPCLARVPVDRACLEDAVATLGARAFRRSLSQAERDRLTAFLGRQMAVDPRTGLRQFLTYLISSPELLFRTELGPEGDGGRTVALTGFERASALSFWLTDGPPDAQLLEAAQAGALERPEGIAAHVRRLAAPGSAGGWLRFLREQFRTDHAAGARKDAMVHPAWTEEIARELAREGEAFLRQAVWGEDGRLATLLAADFTMANQLLARFYGLPDPGPGAALVKVPVRAGERAGLLTQAGLQASLASDVDTSPVMRGLYVREAVLCGHVPPPPPNISNVPPQPDGKRTQRERLASHSGDPSCAGCHSLMDPLGLAFEVYDPVGRYRSTEAGKAIDASGAVDLDGREQRFADAVELARQLAGAAAPRACFVTRAFEYAHGRAPHVPGIDHCAVERLGRSFERSGGHLLELAVAIATDDSFFIRQNLVP
jgi:hypothetical protein